MRGQGLIAAVSKRLPGLKRLPILRLILIAELAIVAKKHYELLTQPERRRLRQILAHPRHISEPDKEELRALVHKMEPRAFAGSAADKLSPVPLPKRLTRPKF